jgi:hypothetical protein
MLELSKRFGKHYNFHLQGECILVGGFGNLMYGRQLAAGESYVMELIGGAKERTAIPHPNIRSGSPPNAKVLHLTPVTKT